MVNLTNFSTIGFIESSFILPRLFKARLVEQDPLVNDFA